MSAHGIQLRAATADDDAGLRTLARETAVSGTVQVAMEREPLYAAGDPLAARVDTVVAECDGVLVGCGSRVVRAGWWDGKLQPLAYLSGLRVHPSRQRRVGCALRRGFGWIDAVSEEPAAATWTAIFSENKVALKVLAGSRAGLPRYLDRGRLACRLLLTRRRGPLVRRHVGPVEVGAGSDVPAMIALRHRWSVGRPLALPLDASCFQRTDPFPALRPEDFVLWRRGGKLAGMLAVWDMRSVRQIRVLETPDWWHWVRGAARIASRAAGWPCLPAPGDILAVGYAGFFSVEGDDPVAAAALIEAARRLAGERGLDFLCVCLHESDPLVALVDGGIGISAEGRLFEVVPRGGNPRWTSGTPVIEPALL